MPRLRHLLTLLPLTLAATLAQAEDWPAPIKQIEAKGAKILASSTRPAASLVTLRNTRTVAWPCT